MEVWVLVKNKCSLKNTDVSTLRATNNARVTRRVVCEYNKDGDNYWD